MDSQLLTTILSGFFSMASAFGSIYLKDYLDRRKLEREQSLLKNKVKTDNKVKISIPKTTNNLLSIFSFRKPLLILLFTFMIGSLSRFFRPMLGSVHWESIIALGLLFVLVIIFLIQRIKSQLPNRQLFFQLDILMLWSGFTFGWSIIHGDFWDDLLITTIGWWLGCAIIGSIILRIYKQITMKSN